MGESGNSFEGVISGVFEVFVINPILNSVLIGLGGYVIDLFLIVKVDSSE